LGIQRGGCLERAAPTRTAWPSPRTARLSRTPPEMNEGANPSSADEHCLAVIYINTEHKILISSPRNTVHVR
jgi:hypothetical protein